MKSVHIDPLAGTSKVHDKVVPIFSRDGTVTLQMTPGYMFGKPILYRSTEANDPLIAPLGGHLHARAEQASRRAEGYRTGRGGRAHPCVCQRTHRRGSPVPAARQLRAVG